MICICKGDFKTRKSWIYFNNKKSWWRKAYYAVLQWVLWEERRVLSYLHLSRRDSYLCGGVQLQKFWPRITLWNPTTYTANQRRRKRSQDGDCMQTQKNPKGGSSSLVKPWRASRGCSWKIRTLHCVHFALVELITANPIPSTNQPFLELHIKSHSQVQTAVC